MDNKLGFNWSLKIALIGWFIAWAIAIIAILFVVFGCQSEHNQMQFGQTHRTPKPAVVVDVNSPEFRAMITCILMNRAGERWGPKEYQAEVELLKYMDGQKNLEQKNNKNPR